jgi:hypothetical protein
MSLPKITRLHAGGTGMADWRKQPNLSIRDCPLACLIKVKARSRAKPRRDPLLHRCMGSRLMIQISQDS